MKYLLLLLLTSHTSFATASFVEKFFYTVEGSCKEPKKLEFWQAKTMDPAKLGKDELGRPKEAYVSLQLFPDQTYWAIYGERAIKEIADGKITYAFIYEQRDITGSWKLEGKTLHLENLGTAEASKYEALIARPYPSLKITLNQTFNDAAALNKKVNLMMAMTTEGPRGQMVYEYCRDEW